MRSSGSIKPGMERRAGFSASGSSQARIASMRQGSFGWMTKQGRIDYPQHTFITKRVGIYEVLFEDLNSVSMDDVIVFY
jgi:hypothetical protein